MIQLSSKDLTSSTVTHLAAVQSQIDSGTSFIEKVDRAQVAWNSKEGSIVKKTAFREIKDALIDMCVGVEICNYCENNEATDVEHIYPKSFFPERAFRWTNYLLACKTCNSGYKLDKFAVFSPTGSNTFTELVRKNQPTTKDAVLIDPRTEDPLQFFWLDIQNKSFFFTPRLDLNSRDKSRAEYTLELLGLNKRSTLAKAREKAANDYLDRLERYLCARDAKTVNDLENCVRDPDLIDQTIPLDQEKHRICQKIIADLQTLAHPTVWHELKRQRNSLPKTNRLLASAPEALTW